MAKGKNTGTRPFEGLAKLYEKYTEELDELVIFLIRGFLFVASIILILATLLATGLLII